VHGRVLPKESIVFTGITSALTGLNSRLPGVGRIFPEESGVFTEMEESSTVRE